MRMLVDRIRRHLADPASQHRKIAQGFLWVSLFVFVGKLAGAGKEMTIAWRYGVSETVDAYVFIFNLINWPVSIWFSILTMVLVPLVAHLRQKSPAELPRFRAELAGLTLSLGLILMLLAWFALPRLLQAGWLGLSGRALTEALNMIGGMALLAPLGVAISLCSAWLLAAGRHRNTLFEAIPALTLLLFLLLPPGLMPEPLLWGTVAGFSLHMAALAVPLRQRGELPLPAFSRGSQAWQSFWGGIGIVAVGQILMSITNLIDQFFAAGLGPGALSTLSYANRILGLVLGLGATAIGRATLPVFSEAHAHNETHANLLALHWAKLMFLFGLVVSLVGWLSAPSIVAFLFERGAFTQENTLTVSNAFRYGLLQVPFYALALTLVNLMASQKKYHILLISGVIGLVVKAAAAIVLVQSMQLSGLILSSAVVYFANSLFFYACARNPKSE